MIRVIVTEVEYRKAEEVFTNTKGYECIPAPSDEAALAEVIRENTAQYVIIGVEEYTGPLYDVLPQKGVIARFGVGHEGVDKQKARERGIYCTNTPGVLEQSVAECAIGLMLGAARHIPTCASDSKNGRWNVRVGVELSGKTLAIIGCGHIGRRAASIANLGFGMKVVGCDPVEPMDRKKWGIQDFTSDFAFAVKNAAFVSLHIPDMPTTKDFINRARLNQMPRESVLINTARGGVVDEDALYDAIVAERIAVAALDVFKTEPYLPQSPGKDLRTLDRVIMTPHVGSSTKEACHRMAFAALKNIEFAAAGDYEKMSIIAC